MPGVVPGLVMPLEPVEPLAPGVVIGLPAEFGALEPSIAPDDLLGSLIPDGMALSSLMPRCPGLLESLIVPAPLAPDGPVPGPVGCALAMPVAPKSAAQAAAKRNVFMRNPG